MISAPRGTDDTVYDEASDESSWSSSPLTDAALTFGKTNMVGVALIFAGSAWPMGAPLPQHGNPPSEHRDRERFYASLIYDMAEARPESITLAAARDLATLAVQTTPSEDANLLAISAFSLASILGKKHQRGEAAHVRRALVSANQDRAEARRNRTEDLRRFATEARTTDPFVYTDTIVRDFGAERPLPDALGAGDGLAADRKAIAALEVAGKIPVRKKKTRGRSAVTP